MEAGLILFNSNMIIYIPQISIFVDSKRMSREQHKAAASVNWNSTKEITVRGIFIFLPST